MRIGLPRNVAWMVCLCAAMISACSPFGIVDTDSQSPDVLDPKAVKNQDGVLALYHNSTVMLAKVVAGSARGKELGGQYLDNGTILSFVRMVGHVSDELDYRMTTRNDLVGAYPHLDISTRNFKPDPRQTFERFFDPLSSLRIMAAETQAAFHIYGALLSDTILAHAMAIEASALIMTAELYCSGVPLSRLDHNGDIILTRGYSTEEVYAFALAKLDTASTLSRENARISTFIDVLRIRVLLGTGNIQEAAAIARHIETPFQYQLAYPKISTAKNGSDVNVYSKVTIASTPLAAGDPSERMSDRKGSNGLPYVSSQDPRVALPALSDPWAPFVMASGIEARLAEAEAALQREDASWLAILNALRTSCLSSDACPTPAPAGTGGVAGLGLLEDPGSPAARLNLLFEERAYWLFLRGFRQGDLRRRIRTYRGKAEELYPVGLPEVGNVPYGYMVSVPVPLEEQLYNQRYKGCLHNDA